MKWNFSLKEPRFWPVSLILNLESNDEIIGKKKKMGLLVEEEIHIELIKEK